eukprot:11196667-Lingulodinium_polyedra.AAC.1
MLGNAIRRLSRTDALLSGRGPCLRAGRLGRSAPRGRGPATPTTRGFCEVRVDVALLDRDGEAGLGRG